MIINLRWPHRHVTKVMTHTITMLGADFVCVKCLAVTHYLWQSTLEACRAKIYLTIKETDATLKDMGLL